MSDTEARPAVRGHPATSDQPTPREPVWVSVIFLGLLVAVSIGWLALVALLGLVSAP